MTRQRLILTILGTLAGASLYALIWLGQAQILPARLTLAALVLAAAFFAALLALTGPLAPARAAGRALGLAVAVAGLAFWASFRFAAPMEALGSPILVVAGLVLVLLPLPFVLAQEAADWRHYPALFSAAWGVAMRAVVAWVFVALVWAIIYLGEALLSLAGLDLLGQLIEVPAVPWLITGAVFGLAMAVAQELADLVSAHLVVRLLRLLVPPVLAVVLVFLAGVLIQGPGAFLAGYSLAQVLVLIVAVGAALVTATVDQSDREASPSTLLRGAARLLAAVLVLPAALAAWALWLRVAAHGWTPGRLFAATAVVVALGYGAGYLAAALARRDWMARVRRVNIAMALALIGLAGLWMTPLLNPEAISAQSQMTRYQSGRVAADRLDILALAGWGKAGAAALARLQEQAGGDPDLAWALAQALSPAGLAANGDDAALRAGLLGQIGAAMAVISAAAPGGATPQAQGGEAPDPAAPDPAAARAQALLAAAATADLQLWAQGCAAFLADGTPGCLMVLGDYLPDQAGEEALLILNSADGYISYLGLTLDGAGRLRHLQALAEGPGGDLPSFGPGQALMMGLRGQAPSLMPVPRLALPLPQGGAVGLAP